MSGTNVKVPEIYIILKGQHGAIPLVVNKTEKLPLI